MHDIWGAEIVPPRNVLRGLALGGGCVLLAHRDRRPVGFALGWLGWHDGLHLHSHQVGVVSSVRSGGVGHALKLAQRAQCLEHGVTEMRWTFDPLLRANARLNLLRLGASVVAFWPNCYGERRDAFNTDDTTDRVEVSWRLDRPVGGTTVEPGPVDTVVAVPDDYHALRAADPAAAAGVRASVGQLLATTFEQGNVVVGLTDADGTTGYVVGPRRPS
jgi:predicted GNAT superfamily acetyltransferase